MSDCEQMIVVAFCYLVVTISMAEYNANKHRPQK